MNAGRPNAKNAPSVTDAEREGPGPSARPDELVNSGDLTALPDERLEERTGEDEAAETPAQNVERASAE